MGRILLVEYGKNTHIYIYTIIYGRRRSPEFVQVLFFKLRPAIISGLGLEVKPVESCHCSSSW